MWKYKYVKEYMELNRRAKQAFADGMTIKLSWHGDSLDAEGYKKEFIKALNERINLKVGTIKTKKWDNDYQVRLKRDQRRLEDIKNRIRVYQFETCIVSGKFGHLLTQYGNGD